MKRIIRIICTITLSLGLIGCSKTVDEPCDYCGNTPSVAYKTTSGYGDAHVCKKCSSTCMLCDEKKATKHYENLFGGIVFVCDDCYKEVEEYSRG